MMHLVSCLSLGTWHNMIIILQHARNEHRSARYVWFPNMFRFSSLCFWEYWVSLYSLCFKGVFQRYFEGLHVFHWSVENYLCALSQLQTQSMRLQETRQLKGEGGKGYFRDSRSALFFSREMWNGYFFIVNRDFHSSREAWFCKIIFCETRNKCLIRREPWFSLCLCYFRQPLLRNKWYCVTWQDGWSLLRQRGWVQQGGKLVVVS